MSETPSTLRNLLLLDAATCAAMGVFLVVAARPLARATALPVPLLFWAGVALFPVAAFMLWAARRPAVDPAAARAVVAGNVLWVAGSLLLFVPGVAAPNGSGVVFVTAQAMVVTVLAFLEHRAVRRAVPQAG